MSDLPEFSVINDVSTGSGTNIFDQVNLYGCDLGDGVKVDAFVYIEGEVVIGDGSTIRPFCFIPTGVSIGEHVFIGPNVTFTNDKYPSVDGEWELLETTVGDRAAIGAGSVIGPGVTIGSDAVVGAGSVVLDDVPENATYIGNPARSIDER